MKRCIHKDELWNSRALENLTTLMSPPGLKQLICTNIRWRCLEVVHWNLDRPLREGVKYCLADFSAKGIKGCCRKIRIASPLYIKSATLFPESINPQGLKMVYFFALNKVRMDQIKIKKDLVKSKTMCKNKKLSGLVLLVRELVRLLHGDRLDLRDPRGEEQVQVWALSR